MKKKVYTAPTTYFHKLKTKASLLSGSQNASESRVGGGFLGLYADEDDVCAKGAGRSFCFDVDDDYGL